MADIMTGAERDAVADRGAVPSTFSGGDPAGDANELLDERVAARRLLGHIAAGDMGAVRRSVHQFEHRLGAWSPDPWRLLEHVAELSIQQAGPAAPAEVPTTG
jgi:hypothetical protein